MFATRPAPLPQAAPDVPPGVAEGPDSSILADLLAPEDILLECEATTREGLFACVAGALATQHGLPKEAIVASLDDRERLGSTALGQGVAIPHARLKGLTRPIAAFVRPRAPIPVDAPDGKPVASLLVLLVPEGAIEAHLELLAQAAAMFCDRSFRERLSRCNSAAEIRAVLTGARPS